MTKVYLKESIVSAEQELFIKGVTAISLIEKAGMGLVRECEKFSSVAIFVGTGNNGADGLCAGVTLLEKGKKIGVFTVGEIKSKESLYFLEKLKASGIDVLDYKTGNLTDYECILDCVFGIGLGREVSGEYENAICKINESGKFVVSADIPSGVDSNSGKVMGVAVRADVTVSFSGVKAGYLFGDGADYVGDIKYCDTGIYPSVSSATLFDEPNFPKRRKNTHKGSYGKIAFITGSDKFVGASLLAERSARACLRSGAGLVSLCVPKSLKNVYQSRVLESTLFFLPDKDGKVVFDKDVLDELIRTHDVLCIGMGLGKSEECEKIVCYLLENTDKPIVLDADALNSIVDCRDELKKGKRVVITPHLGEFARLTGKTVDEINPLVDCKEFAREYGVTCHLKGWASVTATPNGETYITASGTPAMAKGGAGDVLSGIISAFIAQGLPNPVVQASYVHGKAGMIAQQNLGEYGVLARDIADSVPIVMQKYVD